MMRFCFIAIAFVSLLVACKKTKPSEKTDVLVQVKEQLLTRTEVESSLPKGLSYSDSLLYAESYVKNWIQNVLIYDVAVRNLGERNKEIDKLVEDYRHSLVRYRYQEQLIEEKLSATITEEEEKAFYEANREKFVLDEALVKGLFLKVPVDAPSLSDLKEWCRSGSESSVEKIEKYSVQNAVIYEYFYNRWVDFAEIIDNIPMQISNSSDFLKARKMVEYSDSSYCYLLNIKDCITAGNIAPFDYSIPQIKEMLINQRKMDFLRNFENDLYNSAIRKGDVIFFNAESFSEK